MKSQIRPKNTQDHILKNATHDFWNPYKISIKKNLGCKIVYEIFEKKHYPMY